MIFLEAKASKTSTYEMDWEFNYQKGINEFYCTYTKCGLCTLAKREHTLARGDACCDFHVVRKG